ncbi:type VII secretion protein EccCb [Actinomadura rugatobispora]|uniref:Type VII secretion protein EccCb n=1 Tax=Actinomadura rugatobispora TaxID=1994 RepID=A0ABW1AJX4_9ACTN|nr:hypothetical protein GCM10010200_007260 [Actinomadura rugatobispora]
MSEDAVRPRTDDLEAALASVATGPELGALLLELRHRAGRSLRGLAEGSGLAEDVITGMLTGRRFPAERGLRAFLGACGVPEARTAPWVAAHAALDRGGLTSPGPGFRAPDDDEDGLSVTIVDGAKFFEEVSERINADPGAGIRADIRAEIRAELRDELRAELREELRAELRAELLEELEDVRRRASAILASAERDARTLLDEALRSRLSAARREGTQPDANVSLTGLLGETVPEEAAPRVREPLCVPIGLDAERRPVELDLRDSGHGPHGMVIGAEGSGKSELLRAIVLGLAMTHPPEELNLVLLEHGDGGTFAGADRLPHVSAHVPNLSGAPARAERVYEALSGEIVRRQQALRAAGDLPSVREYEEARGGRAGLDALPPLLIVVDGASELLARRPDFGDLFQLIARLGRALGLHLLVAARSHADKSLRALHRRAGYVIALRTVAATDSRELLGVPDAHWLPDAPGHGFFRWGTEPAVRFRAASAADVREAVIERLAARGGTPAFRIWRPPLEEAPGLEELLPPLSVTAEHGLTTAGWEHRGGLRAVAGIVDRPFYHRRDPYWLDLSGEAGHVAVVGGPESGKTTAVRALVASLALTHTPEEARFYCLDLAEPDPAAVRRDDPAAGLAALEGLPHVGAVVTRDPGPAGTARDHRDHDRVRRTIAQVTAILERREHAPAQTGPLEDAAHVFLVVDDWCTLRDDFPDLEGSVADLAERGLPHRVHVIASAAAWKDFGDRAREAFGTKLELRLADPSASEFGAKRAVNVPDGSPGRGLTSDGFHFLTALADLGRLVPDVAKAWTGPAAPAVLPLPDVLPAARLPVLVPSGPEGRARIPIGVEEGTLATVHADFAAHPHFLVLGAAGSGRSNLLRHITAAITARHAPEQARVVFIDYRHSLAEVADTEHQIGFTVYADSATALVKDIHASLSRRLSAGGGPAVPGRDWTGAELFVVVDDYDLVARRGADPLRPLADLVPHGREIGLHLVLARALHGTSRALPAEIVGPMLEMGTPCLLLAAGEDAASEKALVERLSPLPPAPRRPAPGRGHFSPGRDRLADARPGPARLIQTPLHAPAAPAPPVP